MRDLRFPVGHAAFTAETQLNTQYWGRDLGAAAIFTAPGSFASKGLSTGLDTSKEKQLLPRGLFAHNHFIIVSSQSVYKGPGVRNPVITDMKLLGGHHINMMFGNTECKQKGFTEKNPNLS